jgi:zinc protease
VERRTLANGLAVLVATVRDFPVVTLDLVLPGGALAEDEARAGLASLTASLLESGAGGRDAAALAEAVDGLGLSLDASASWDSAQVGFTALRSRLDEGTALLADLVLRPEFPAHEVERLRDQRIASLAHSRGDPAGVAGEVAARAFFAPGVPFGRPMGGLASTVAGLGRDDVAAFHAASYVPTGSVLVAAGDLDADEAVALAERHFGGWSGVPAPRPAAVATPAPGGRRVVVAHKAGALQSAVRIGHVGMERTAPDYFAVTVMNAILGGMFSSRLNLNLRERLGYTYGVHSGFTMRRLPGPFMVSTSVQTEVTAHAVSEVLRDVEGMRDADVADGELRDARTYLADVFPLGNQTTDGVAGRLQAIATYGLRDDYYDGYRDGILGVTADAVRDAARRRLRPDETVVVVAGDADAVSGPLEALGIGPVSVVDPAALG